MNPHFVKNCNNKADEGTHNKMFEIFAPLPFFFVMFIFSATLLPFGWSQLIRQFHPRFKSLWEEGFYFSFRFSFTQHAFTLNSQLSNQTDSLNHNILSPLLRTHAKSTNSNLLLQIIKVREEKWKTNDVRRRRRKKRRRKLAREIHSNPLALI